MQSVPSRMALATSVASARVGRRLVVMDSSICVAVMTGLPALLALAMICFWITAICSIGTSTPRSPRATMMPSAACRISSRWSSASERSILAMMKGVVPERLGGGAHGLDVGGGFHERLAHRVHAVGERELQAGAVVIGEGADAEVDARQVEALPGAQFAADGDLAVDVVARDALDDQLHEAVVEKQPVARFHHPGQRLEAHRNPPRVADDVLAGQGEGFAGHELDRLRLDLAEAHLRSGQVGHDGDPAAGGLFGGADAGDAFGVAGEVAVGEVEPRHVQPGADQPFQHLRRIRGGADGGDDLGLVSRWMHQR